MISTDQNQSFWTFRRHTTAAVLLALATSATSQAIAPRVSNAGSDRPVQRSVPEPGSETFRLVLRLPELGIGPTGSSEHSLNRRGLLTGYLAVSTAKQANRHDRNPDPAGRLPLSAEPYDEEPAGFHLRLRDDLLDLAASPTRMTRRQWRKLGIAALAVGAVSLFDEQLHELVRSDRDPSTERFAETVRPLGDKHALGILGAVWLTGKAFGQPKLVAVAEDGLEATIISAGLITPAMKAIAGRNRPREGLGSSSFPGYGRSFPSGEVTVAFTLASVIARHYEQPWVDALSWGFAGLVAWERMRLDAHWGSDVVAGALIGTAVGRWVVRRHRGGREWAEPLWADSPEMRSGPRPRLLFAPRVGEGSYGINVVLRF